MSREIEKRYLLSVGGKHKAPQGIRPEKVTEALGTIPFKVGKLTPEKEKTVLLWRLIKFGRDTSAGSLT